MKSSHIIQQGGLTVGDNALKVVAESSLDTELSLTYHNSEFLGSFERDGQICDYYLAFTNSGTFYYYIPRDEINKEE